MRQIPITCFLLACLWSRPLSADPLSEDAVQKAASRIDEALSQSRVEEGRIHTSEGPLADLPPRADDAMFLRRACIDLAGRLPAAGEIRQFISDPTEEKRAHLVDRLLAEPTAVEVRFRLMAEALRVRDEIGGHSQALFIHWLRQAIQEDQPYDELIAAMLRSKRDVSTDPSAGLMQRDQGDMLHTSTEVARAFLGTDLHCAQCHDHPYDRWTQRQSYEFAGCFASTAEDLPVLPSNYFYTDGKPGDRVPPRYLPLTRLDENDPQSAFAAQPDVSHDLRAQLAIWFTGSQNTRFAEVGALRLWQHLFGLAPKAGRYHEAESESKIWHNAVDRDGCDTPANWYPIWYHEYFDPSEPCHIVVRTLGEEFKKCGYRQQEFLRILSHTMAYQREAIGDVPRFGMPAAPRLRRLPPQVTWDTWVQWLPKTDADARPSADLPQVPEATHPLRLLGQSRREWADESVPVISHQLTSFMIANPLIKRVATSEKLLSNSDQPGRQVEDLFLCMLSRLPHASEKEIALQHLAQYPEQGSQDLAWALLNTSEFMFEP